MPRVVPAPVRNNVAPISSFRSAWMRQDTDVPRHATRGQAWKAPGWSDPDSAAYRCWLFQPDNSDVAYYCAEEDLDFVTPMPKDRSDGPIWPKLYPNMEPTDSQVIGHNLACLCERLDNAVAMLERISGHLYDTKKGRAG